MVDECFQCKLCYVNCPYIPGPERVGARLPPPDAAGRRQVRHANGERRPSARPHRPGAWAAPTWWASSARPPAPLANTAIGDSRARSSARSWRRPSASRRERLLPPFARQRFSHLVQEAARASASRRRQGQVAVFPTCLVEYQNPAIGQDLVKVYERNGIECSLPEGVGCCGAPWLHSGDVDHFTKAAVKNVKVAGRRRAGRQRHRGAPADVRLRAARRTTSTTSAVPTPSWWPSHTYDAAEYLMKVHKGDGDRRSTPTSPATCPSAITYHTPCHLRAQNIGLQEPRPDEAHRGRRSSWCSSAPASTACGACGRRTPSSRCRSASKLADEHRAGRRRRRRRRLPPGQHRHHRADRHGCPMHPLQVVARAYGIPPSGGLSP